MNRAVLFDLDETLTDRRRSIQRYAERLTSDFDLTTPGPEILADAIRAADGNGYAARSAVFEAVRACFARQVNIAQEQLAAHWDAAFPAVTVARAGVVEALRVLKSRGYLMGVVTNGVVRRQAPKLLAMGMREWFEVVVISEAVGVKKPASEIFLAASDALGCGPGNCWFIGDHPVNDVEGARRAGMQAVWFRGVHAWPTELEPARWDVATFAELPALLPE